MSPDIMLRDGDTFEEADHRRDIFRFIVDFTDEVTTAHDLKTLIYKSANTLRRLIDCSYVCLEVQTREGDVSTYSAYFKSGPNGVFDTRDTHLTSFPDEEIFKAGKNIIYSLDELKALSKDHPKIKDLVDNNVKVLLNLPLQFNGDPKGIYSIGFCREFEFTDELIAIFEKIAMRLSIMVNVILLENYSKHSVISVESHDPDDEEGLNELTGTSPAIQSVYEQIRIVAQSDATVLLLGETGTGKSHVAQAIHNMSRRRNRPMVKMNCTAIPAELMESELFGHEKGSFTGAFAKRVGHVEQADKSTLFLDEIGDMPMELQPKLLNVLQEKQVVRLGRADPISVDVRFIAATNSNLPQKVHENLFRRDLYYRLNVFPITIPPLRERGDDIIVLSKQFVGHFAKKIGRSVTDIDPATLELMTKLPWPGNIRELQNVIERAVIMTTVPGRLNLSPAQLLRFTVSDDIITDTAPPASLSHPPRIPLPPHAETEHAPLPNTTKEAIVAALKQAAGKIGGETGAAHLLGLKRTTLLARCKKFGIDVESFRK